MLGARCSVVVDNSCQGIFWYFRGNRIYTHTQSMVLCVLAYDMCVFSAQGKYLSSRRSWTVIRKRRRKRLWRRSSHLWQLAKMLGEPGEIAVGLHRNKSPSVWRRLSHNSLSPVQCSVPRCRELHADGQLGTEKAGLSVPDELCQESARHGHHGCEHLCKGNALSLKVNLS